MNQFHCYFPSLHFPKINEEQFARVKSAVTQVALSWTIQKLAISIFALQGSTIILCSITGFAIGVAVFFLLFPKS